MDEYFIEESQDNNQTAQLTFVILAMIYAIISVYGFIRVLHTCKFTKFKWINGSRLSADTRLAQYFYLMIFFESLISCA